MKTIWILGDQLPPGNSALYQASSKTERILIIESRNFGHHLKYHKKRLSLVYSGLRHCALEMRATGWQVDHYPLEDTVDYETGIRQHLKRHPKAQIYVAEPNDWPTAEVVRLLAKKYPITTVPTTRFLLARNDFKEWAADKKQLLMEHHYRAMRQKTGYLMEKIDGKMEPVGGTWNLDHANRKTYKDWVKDGSPLPHPRRRFPPDATTRAVLATIEREFADHPGSTEGFDLPVTRQDALLALEDFITHRLGKFGDYEDLMIEGEPTLFHSVLTPSLNLGLLTPAECVEAAIDAWKKGRAPLNSVEGFVRQIIGWREFINGVYWQKMPAYREVNALEATRPLPSFFYTGDTKMNCLRETLGQVIDSGYNHHIQRLMVLGNFLLLAGIRPQEALNWFLEMYVDAWDWVMAANVLGMVLHADGGAMATKPYAAGSGYISKMSNYCAGCQYRTDEKTGDTACPFNYLYWNFFDQHAAFFEKNIRVAMPLNSWKKKTPAAQKAVRDSAKKFLANLES